MFAAFQVGPFQPDFQQGALAVQPSELDVGGGIPSAAVRARARRRYIMPDGRTFFATTDEALQLLRMYSVPKEAAEAPRKAKGQPVIRAPQATLEKRDVRFIPATDSAVDTYKAVISERFVYRAPAEAYRQAEIMLNRMRDDEEALLLLL